MIKNQESAHLLNFLDQLPDKLYARTVTHQYSSLCDSSKSLQQRCTGVLDIRRHLQHGDKISQKYLLEWLLPEDAKILHQRLTDTKLLLRTACDHEYADDVLLNILNWLDKKSQLLMESDKNQDVRYKTKKEPPSIQDLQQHENYSDIDVVGGTDHHAKAVETQSNHSQKMTDTSVTDKLELTPSYMEQAEKTLSQTMLDTEDQHQLAIDKVMLNINQYFAVERQLGVDLNKGISSITDIRSLIRLHKIIKSSSYLQAIIKLIGRSKVDKKSLHDIAGLNHKDCNDAGLDTRLPEEHLIKNISGVYYGDDLTRMLPSQMIMLGSNRLRYLWYAKRAERQLLNYNIKGVLSDHVPDFSENSIDTDNMGTVTYQQQGPMIVCLDTSASMKGKPEIMAKAITLETMRVARLEKRACFVFVFSGMDEITEFNLDLESNGWASILKFINNSFHGGTDIEGVILSAYNKIHQLELNRADILLISDGRFSLANTEAFVSSQAQLPGVRIFGIQVAQWKSTGFRDICHRVFDFSYV